MCPVGPLGPKKAPAPPSPPPEWKPHTDPRFEVNRQGQMRTRLPLPGGKP